MTTVPPGASRNPVPWNRTIPRSRLFDALSLLLPAGEAFVIATLEQWRRETDSAIAAPVQAEVDRLLREERAHQRAHARYNQALVAETPAASAAALRASQAADGLAGLSLPMKLALTVAFEHLTTVLSREILDRPYLLPDDGSMHSRTWRWHAQEEVEHSHVAAEVAALSSIGHARRSLALCLATAYLSFDVLLCWCALCRCDIASKGTTWWRLLVDTSSFVLWGLPSLARMAIGWSRGLLPTRVGWT